MLKKKKAVEVSLKEQLKRRGFNMSWVAKQIEMNRSSFGVYINNEGIMPSDIRAKIMKFLKTH